LDKPRILIVDDEPNVRFVLERTLVNDGYILDTAADGAEAIQKLGQAAYDLLLLDLNMRPVDGVQVMNAVRERGSDIVVIILTAHSSIESAVEALRLGAFDYLFKPTSPDAIRRRVSEGIRYRQQALRRARLLTQIEGLHQSLADLDKEISTLGPDTSPRRFLRSGKLVIDKYHRSAMLGEALLDLTTTEFDLLVALTEAAPAAVAPQQLVRSALHYEAPETEASEIIKYHIHQLRQKIEGDPAKPKYIKTVRYKGYLWSGGL